MNLKRNLIRKLWATIPPGEQQVMVYNFLDWLFSDLIPTKRREKAKLLAPRLIDWIAEGKVGLYLVVYQHLKRLPLITTLRKWTGNLQAAAE